MNSTLVYRFVCLAATLSLTLLAVAVSTATANPVAVPSWSYWTNVQAGKNLIRQNPQRIDYQGHKTTITTATCKGTGAAKASRYRAFACAVRWHDDTMDCCNLGTTLYVTTSTAKRNAVACWSRSQVALARGECRPPKLGG